MNRRKALIALICVFPLIAACVYFPVRRHVSAESTYRKAEKCFLEGNNVEAYRLFKGLKGYRDSGEKMTELTAEDEFIAYKAAEPGEPVFFGRWEQDNDALNGPESIEWIVLDRIDGQLLLLSSACLAGMAYNSESFAPVTWESCSLRAWLNGEFFERAFTDGERAMIPYAENENPDHSIAETPGGRNTVDRVFLLSETDTVIYLSGNDRREMIGRAYASEAARQGGLETDEEGFSAWWLRSPGMYEYIAQFVDRDGAPYMNGASTDIDYLCGVRPVIWLDCEGGNR